MKKELQKLRIKKAKCMANQANLVECLSKIAELTESPLKGSFGSEASKCVLVGQSDLDQLVDHVKSAFEKGSQLSQPPSCPSPSLESTHSNWEDDDQPKVKRAKKLLIYSSDDEEDGSQSEKSVRQPVVKVIERKSEHVVPPLSPQFSSSNKSRPSYASTKSCLPSKCATKRGNDWDDERFESREEYEDCRNIDYPALVKSRDCDESEPRTKSLPEKIGELFADDNEDPVCIEEDNCPEGVLCSVCKYLFDDKASFKLKHNWEVETLLHNVIKPYFYYRKW